MLVFLNMALLHMLSMCAPCVAPQSHHPGIHLMCTCVAAVSCRIRPPGVTGDLSPSCVDVGLEGDLAVYDQASGTKRVFKVDRVFDQNVNQTAVYDDTQPLIRSVLDGK